MKTITNCILWLLMAAVIIISWRHMLHTAAILIIGYYLIKFAIRLLILCAPLLLLILAAFLLTL